LRVRLVDPASLAADLVRPILDRHGRSGHALRGFVPLELAGHHIVVAEAAVSDIKRVTVGVGVAGDDEPALAIGKRQGLFPAIAANGGILRHHGDGAVGKRGDRRILAIEAVQSGISPDFVRCGCHQLQQTAIALRDIKINADNLVIAAGGNKEGQIRRSVFVPVAGRPGDNPLGRKRLGKNTHGRQQSHRHPRKELLDHCPSPESLYAQSVGLPARSHARGRLKMVLTPEQKRNIKTT
jgi:hypothetical protein